MGHALGWLSSTLGLESAARRAGLGLLTLMMAASLTAGLATAQDAGQAKLDEATARKLNANSQADLAKVVELCEQALEAGLDEVSTQLAKGMIAASSLQRAQLLLQQLPKVVNNASALRNLTMNMRADLEKAISYNDKLAEAHMLLARLETLPGGSRDRALNHMNLAIEALQDKPVDQSAAYLLRAGLRSSNDDKIADISKALELDPTNKDAWQAKIALQLASRKFEEARQDAEKLLADDESNDFAFQVVVETLIEMGRLDEVHEILSKRIEKQPENGDYYRWRGRLEMSRDRNDEAISDFSKAIELNPRDFEALLFRGQIYFGQEQIDKASRDVSDSLLIEPDSSLGVLLRAHVSARQKRYADAIKDMEMLVRHNPSNLGWIMQLASFYQLDNRPRLAIQLLDQLLAENNKEWRAMRTRGDAKLAISQHHEAAEDYRRAVRIAEASKDDPNLKGDVKDLMLELSGLYNNLSWLLSTSPKDDLRNGAESLELALKACEATEYKEAHILSTLAAAYAETGDFENARQWASKAVELGRESKHDQIDQLEKELESYQQNKPWREEQSTEENKKPLSAAEAIDT
ncbi:MAG: tetratricopeptide repeat protein [Pirellulaceae bacterium]|nr:tetratricopeptide repeat protein [Pirellulaceae bacterium]